MPFSRSLGLSPLADRRKKARSNEVRRRPDKNQAQALEVLAHALEYLVDEALRTGRPVSVATMDALDILAEKNRLVFAECPEILSLSRRLGRFLPSFLTLPPVTTGQSDRTDPTS